MSQTEKTETEPEETCPDRTIINEVQLILAEKRTSLAGLRTGITVFALPLSMIGLLIATSSHYDAVDVLALLVPFLFVNLLLMGLGVYLVIRSVVKIHREDRLILKMKRRHSAIAELID